MDDGQNNDLRRIFEAVEQIRSDLGRLESRVAQLEHGRAPDTGGQASDEATHPTPIDSEVVMTIAAALAAYLGEAPRIRAIRLLRSDAWAQEGRTTIQAWYSVSPPP